MTEPGGGDTPRQEAEEGSAWGRMWAVLSSPTEGFSALAVKPTFAVALVVLLALGAGVGFVAMGKVTPENLVRTMEDRGQTVPPKLQDDPEAFLRTMQWAQTIFGTALGALFYLAAAGIFVALFRMVGSDLTYRQSLATTVHGLLPLGVAAVVGVIVILGRDSIGLDELQAGNLVASNLGVLAGEETGKVMRALLSSIDLFSFWSLFLLATGYRIVARVSSGAAWSVVLALWGVAIAIKAGLAAIF